MSSDNMSVKVSNAGEEFRSHSAWGGLKLVGIMEICEIVMESIGKEEPIAGLRQVGGAGGAVRQCAWCGAESIWVPALPVDCWAASGAGAVVECQ